jgi:hypothetical protein
MEKIEWLYEGREVEAVHRNGAVGKCEDVLVKFNCFYVHFMWGFQEVVGKIFNWYGYSQSIHQQCKFAVAVSI